MSRSLKTVRNAVADVLVEAKEIMSDPEAGRENLDVLSKLQSYATDLMSEVYQMIELAQAAEAETEGGDDGNIKRRRHSITNKRAAARRKSMLSSGAADSERSAEEEAEFKVWLGKRSKKIEELMFLISSRCGCGSVTGWNTARTNKTEFVCSPEFNAQEQGELAEYIETFFRRARIRRE
mmetsp:Transcript_20441/g.28318  ORF Transcript_20441/g.28318 Transcript_20441/m.28318 type:complete len:180 (-) Transcript_20441:225-764(-)|eukprot:CAMPEP_0196590016 /NCGR_PEP_ID=MMETSP1081-20130531/65289_1 /TAXON_ID=36882 /ORGANISM="Pyramimonas amylifera, Strain CCMP720" /LENGTH=179 /DNA_ID=CAMNT_0041912985 /DNA_START=35 /DNA_END=574 /DNA_ORIENTATION=+